jgi:hypothetical protein
MDANKEASSVPAAPPKPTVDPAHDLPSQSNVILKTVKKAVIAGAAEEAPVMMEK